MPLETILLQVCSLTKKNFHAAYLFTDDIISVIDTLVLFQVVYL